MRAHGNGQLIGTSSVIVELIEEIDRIAQSDAKVLVTGESGVGKELVAAAIHRQSARSARPLVTSIKGALGESGASGSAAVAAALLCGSVGKVPPISGLSDPSDAAASLRLARVATDLEGDLVLVNSVASGGALFSLLLRTVR